MNQRTILLSLLLFLFFNAFSQDAEKRGITLYKTYDDYVEGKGVFYEGEYIFKSKTSTPWKDILRFKNKNAKGDQIKKLKFELKDYWGFKQNDNLFRITYWTALLVISQGDIIYYEQITNEYNCWISKDLNSEMIEIYK